MKYKVELEFTVDESYLDEFDMELINDGEATVESIADYSIKNSLSKYEDAVCSSIGFPGYYEVKAIKENCD